MDGLEVAMQVMVTRNWEMAPKCRPEKVTISSIDEGLTHAQGLAKRLQAAASTIAACILNPSRYYHGIGMDQIPFYHIVWDEHDEQPFPSILVLTRVHTMVLTRFHISLHHVISIVIFVVPLWFLCFVAAELSICMM